MVRISLERVGVGNSARLSYFQIEFLSSHTHFADQVQGHSPFQQVVVEGEAVTLWIGVCRDVAAEDVTLKQGCRPRQQCRGRGRVVSHECLDSKGFKTIQTRQHVSPSKLVVHGTDAFEGCLIGMQAPIDFHASAQHSGAAVLDVALFIPERSCVISGLLV